jgi:Pentapeptide repeats (8 copies)
LLADDVSDLRLSSRNIALPHAFMKLSRLLGLECLCLLLAGITWAQEPDTCPHPEGWRPTEEELQRILSDHKHWTEKWKGTEWAVRNAEGKANLCNVDLRDANLSSTNLERADLSGANLRGTDLNNAYLRGANLNNADLVWAKLNGADLVWAELNGADLFDAELNDANVSLAKLSKARLSRAKLNGANLSQAELNGANLRGTKLNNADLEDAKLDNADLSGAQLENAELIMVSLTGARLAYANLMGAVYAPISAPPNSYLAGIRGLHTVTFPRGQEIGLVQLRDLLQKAGLRELEREVTFAIEHGRTRHALADWLENPGAAVEGIFRMMAFDWTTGYGLNPSRALKIIAVVWLLLISVYFWPIRLTPKRSTAGGIYQVWPSDRIEANGGGVSLSKSANVSRLQRGTLAALGHAAYFSLLSAFHIGWRDLNVGTWIVRIQPREYALRATGWVRVVSGIQALLSVYLLAMWALTYFGRPFQ